MGGEMGEAKGSSGGAISALMGVLLCLVIIVLAIICATLATTVLTLAKVKKLSNTTTAALLVMDSGLPPSCPTLPPMPAPPAVTPVTFPTQLPMSAKPALAAATAKCTYTSDTYLAANVSTVRWGVYDINSAPKARVKSGDIITVEVISHHSGHDYAKMIRGDPAVTAVYSWLQGQTLTQKAVPKPTGSGVHIVTGPIGVCGADVGDVLQVDILSVKPRKNPSTGKTFGTNSAKFAGYQFRVPHPAGGGPKGLGGAYTTAGGDETITVYEFITDPVTGALMWGKPVYQYMYPTVLDPAGDKRTTDNMPALVVPHAVEMTYGNVSLGPLAYPPGLNGTVVLDNGNNTGPWIIYNPYNPSLDWKVPLRPHIGIMAVMPNNTLNWGGPNTTTFASTLPPSRFGGNVDDWRIGPGGSMYYRVEVPGANLVLADTHAAMGDTELAGTAMETSMTVQIQIWVHKAADGLPTKVGGLSYPMLETQDSYIIHGFAYNNYLDQLAIPSTIGNTGNSSDMALRDCYTKTRDFLMSAFALTEPESITIMALSATFTITQIVDSNWGVHATIPKWVFDKTGKPYEYSCDEPINGRTPTNSGNAGPSTTMPIVGRHLSETNEATEETTGWNRMGDPLLEFVTGRSVKRSQETNRQRRSLLSEAGMDDVPLEMAERLLARKFSDLKAEAHEYVQQTLATHGHLVHHH